MVSHIQTSKFIRKEIKANVMNDDNPNCEGSMNTFTEVVTGKSCLGGTVYVVSNLGRSGLENADVLYKYSKQKSP